MRDGFSVAFWGGHLWVFTGISDANANSMLLEVAPEDGTFEMRLPDVGFEVVGAGVSTCAPTTDVR
jgi:hypothetical protein